MRFNILSDPLFPVLTRAGAHRTVRFAELATVDGPDAPIAFAWPRADFNIASFELVIGIASLVMQPRTHEDWLTVWQEPPTLAQLDEALQPYHHAFNLNGDGPLFMQDREPLDGEANPIEALLIDTPGANGQKKNADLLTHGGRYDALGLPAAAMALYTLQQFAPSGGAGNRTSMRGGGPMTNLVLPGQDGNGQHASLWHAILSNLPLFDGYAGDDELARVLPWLAPTLTSDRASGNRIVHELDPLAHPLEAFFGMPRRLRLQFEGEGACSMTGALGPLCTGFVQTPYGVNYGLWQHPLTPYRSQKEGGERYSAKPKSGHFGYRDWVSVTFGDADHTRAMPSANVKALTTRGGRIRTQFSDHRLRVAGWAMNNMEAISYLHADQPLYIASTQDEANRLARFARALAGSGDEGAGLVRSSLRAALFSSGATIDIGASLFEDARSNFYTATEVPFHEQVKAGLDPDFDEPSARLAWLHAMREAASQVFETHTVDTAADSQSARRIADAHKQLMLGFAGYGKQGGALFRALELPPPPKGKSAASKPPVIS